MSESTGTDVVGSADPGSAGRRARWLIALAVVATVALCGCMSTVFLVLTGIIAEPETVIEHLVRTLSGG